MRIFTKKSFRFDHPTGAEGPVVSQALSFHDFPDWVKESSMFKLAFGAGEIDLPETKADESDIEADANVSGADAATLKDLRAKAKELGIEGFNKMKKDDLLEAIEKASAQDQDKDPSEDGQKDSQDAGE